MDCIVCNGRLRLNQGRIFWRETGTGKAIAFIHGEYSDSSQWEQYLQILGPHYHCFTPDLLGFGESDLLVRSQSIQWQTEILDALFEQLNLKTLYLMGDSLGAWIATRYALNHPERVKGLILFAPIGAEPFARFYYFWSKLILLRLPILPWCLHLLRPLGRLLGVKSKIERTLNYRQILLRSAASRRLLFQRRFREIETECLQPELARIQVPTLILAPPNRDHQGALFAASIPQATAHNVKTLNGAIAALEIWLQDQAT